MGSHDVEQATASADAEAGIGGRNRQAILRAATALFSRKGFGGTRMGDIAAEAGVPRPNVYYYFASKKAIYQAVIDHLIAGWDDALKHIDAASEPGPALAAYVRAKLEHARRNTAESRVFAAEILGGATFLTKKDRRHMQAATRRATDVVKSWIAAGKLKPIDPRHLFIQLWAATQFYADFEIVAADALDQPHLRRLDYEDAARALIETILHGIGAKPE